MKTNGTRSAVKLNTMRVNVATQMRFEKSILMPLLLLGICFFPVSNSSVLLAQDIKPGSKIGSPSEELPIPVPGNPNQKPNVPDVLKPDDLEANDYREIMMRGPMHEAFVELHSLDSKPNAIVEKEPPQPINEIPPEFKPEGLNIQWIPGYWAWDVDKEDFLWVSGLWRDVPPDRKWIPGYWATSTGGYRWVSGFWQEEAAEAISYQPAPPANIDSGPAIPAPSDNHFYVPGNWVYNSTSYDWSPGYWQPNVDNWVWNPARYTWTPRGFVYLSGYWDHIIDRRGVYFAPIYFRSPVYRNVGYRYTPNYSINIGLSLLPHLFVNTRHGHFYFGDWYGPRFQSRSIYPWIDSHLHRRQYYDPLLAYYASPSRRHNHTNTYSWLRQKHRNFDRNEHLRPRHTYSDQQRHLNASLKKGNGNRPAHYGVDYRKHAEESRSRFASRSMNPGEFGNQKKGSNNVSSSRRFSKLSKNDIAALSKKLVPMQKVKSNRATHERTSTRVREGGSQIRTEQNRAEQIANSGRNGRLSLDDYRSTGGQANRNNRADSSQTLRLTKRDRDNSRTGNSNSQTASNGRRSAGVRDATRKPSATLSQKVPNSRGTTGVRSVLPKVNSANKTQASRSTAIVPGKSRANPIARQNSKPFNFSESVIRGGNSRSTTGKPNSSSRPVFNSRSPAVQNGARSSSPIQRPGTSAARSRPSISRSGSTPILRTNPNSSIKRTFTQPIQRSSVSPTRSGSSQTQQRTQSRLPSRNSGQKTIGRSSTSRSSFQRQSSGKSSSGSRIGGKKRGR